MAVCSMILSQRKTRMWWAQRVSSDVEITAGFGVSGHQTQQHEEGLGKTRHSQSQFLQLQHWKKTQRFILLRQGNLAVVVSFE